MCGAMAVDVLSDVLQAVQLTGVVFFDFNLTAPWVAEAPPSSTIAAQVIPGAERVFEYHFIAEGSAWGQLVDGTPLRLREGDFLVFPHGSAHVLSSAPGLRAEPDFSIYARGDTPLPLLFERGGPGDERTRLVCGFFGCDERPYNPLLLALPQVIHLPAAAPDALARPLGTLLHMTVQESRRDRPGSRNVLTRLAELTFVEAVRRYLAEMPASQHGWLAGLRDPVVGPALAALHGAPRDSWTVEGLGRAVGVSRSVLAARFTDVVGHPPMHYLTLWRMQLASRLIRDGRPIADVADAVGYESQAAFSRAFRKVVGEWPSSWQRR